MTASAPIDGRIDWNGTLANLIATVPGTNMPVGTKAYTTDFGTVNWNGSTWAMETSATIAANVGGSQSTGTLIATALVNVTAAGASYSVTLPASVPGMMIVIHNISVQTVLVFPSAGGTTTEKINALSANASISMSTATSTTFTCVVAGQWYTVPRVPS